MALVLPGAAQPALAAGLGLDLADSGLVASTLSLGLGVGVVAGGPLADRLPRRPLFVASAGLAALAGVAPLASGSFAAALVATAGIGLGAGLYETLLNAAVPERAPASAAARLSLLHAGATLGAGLGAPALGALAQAAGFTQAYAAVGAGFAAVALLGLAVRFPPPLRKGDGPRPSVALLTKQDRPLSDGSLSGAGALVRLAAACFAYVGLETALSVFAAPFALDRGLDVARGMRSLSAFWIGLLLARIAYAALQRPARAAELRLAGVAGASVLAAGAAFEALAPEALFLATGLALGVVFPLLVLFAGDAMPGRRATAVGLVVGAGSLGGFCVPWLTGGIGDRFGAPAAVGALAVLALLIAAVSRGRRSS